MDLFSQPKLTDTKESITGVLERILYINEENQYCIGELRSQGMSNCIIVAGLLPSVQCGETLLLKGDWVRHPKYGNQFKIEQFESKLPATVYGVKKYLSSGLVPGIGKVYAQKIVEHFKEDTFKIISEESARLMEIPGIGKSRAQALKKAWDSQMALREVMLFLKTYGVGTSQCLRLVKQYGEQAKQVLMNNPYKVAREIKGIGFKTADKIAINLGFANDSEKRVDAGILFAMQECEDNGHTCVDEATLISHALALLDVSTHTITDRLKILINQKELVQVS